MIRLDELLRRLADNRVEFVVIGGVAAVAQGYDGATFDFDICARFAPENLDRLVASLLDAGLRFAHEDKIDAGFEEHSEQLRRFLGRTFSHRLEPVAA